MFRIRFEDEIAKLMLTDNCYKCMHINNYYYSTAERSTSWCYYEFNKPKNNICSKYVEIKNYNLDVEYK